MDIDLITEPLGEDGDGNPSTCATSGRPPQEIEEVIDAAIAQRDVHQRLRRRVRRRRALAEPADARGRRRSSGTPNRPTCASRRTSRAWTASREPVTDIDGARVLAKLGDSVTTDHISPAGAIKTDSPAGQYLTEHGVERKDFNSYGSRRGNHEVMIRGTFANIRLRNQLAPGNRGRLHPRLHPADAPVTTIYDASVNYAAAGHPAGHARRQGVRLRLVARLGGEGHRAARRPRGDRRDLRADPSLQPDRHGRAAAAVPRGAERRVARPGPARRRSTSPASRR